MNECDAPESNNTIARAELTRYSPVTPQVLAHLNSINVPQLKLKEKFEKLIQRERIK